ncbi:sorting nexin-14-like isoform X2 [Rhincodon typus]|nr:sorting nexin-14-like isoform X2 [Rhincodon typus]
MLSVRRALQELGLRLRFHLFRDIGRQYPVFCFIMLLLTLSTLLFNRYLHILMMFWSFLAGVVTFYCSLGPDSLLPNILFHTERKPK